jgi:predicted nuclease of restriction endonuclease-like (RecB) superfamily
MTEQKLISKKSNQRKTLVKDQLYFNVKQLIEQSQSFVVKNVNTILVFTNYHIGKMIIENEQQGKERAVYAQRTLKKLSGKLTKDFGNGYSEDNLNRMRNFYLLYNTRISATVLRKSEIRKNKEEDKTGKLRTVFTKFQLYFPLSWSHYSFLTKIINEDERNFYEIESAQNNWSFRELQRQYNTSLYERLALSKNKKAIKVLCRKGQIINKPIDMIKEPYILEFLGLKKEKSYNESQLETAIINRLENFLLELGKGFLFQSRQQRISFSGESFYIDLVLYNRILKCFVLIDLKIGELKHQDIGQMQMYVNFYDREIKIKNENKTVGIILCKQANKAVIEYTLPKDNKSIFASEYMLYLPKKKQLQKLLEQ